MNMDTTSNKSSFESHKFSLGELGIDVDEVPEYQVIREKSLVKRRSILREISELSSLYDTQDEVIKIYDTITQKAEQEALSKTEIEQQKKQCCIIC